MKYLILLLLLSSCSPGPIHQIGECLQPTHAIEEWQTPYHIYKIQAIGKQGYKTSWWDTTDNTWNNTDFPLYFSNLSYHKVVPCPDNYKVWEKK